MTDQKHTPEPWEVVAMRGLAVCVVQESDHGVLIALDGQENSMNDMKRIVACVNAMRGIDDPAAFMRAVQNVKKLDGLVGDLPEIRKIVQHLKGGAE